MRIALANKAQPHMPKVVANRTLLSRQNFYVFERFFKSYKSLNDGLIEEKRKPKRCLTMNPLHPE